MPNFSHWVRKKILEHQVMGEKAVQLAPLPKNYLCKHCLGNHWTHQCPSIEVIE